MTYPDSSTTGPAAGGYTPLTPQTASDIQATGPWPSWVQVIGGGPPTGSLLIQSCSFTSGMNIYADNVTFLGCEVTTANVGNAAIYNHGGKNFTVKYCQISAPDQTSGNSLQYCVDSFGAGPFTIDHCNFFWWQNAIQVADVANVTITNNYIHDPVLVTGAHLDGIYLAGGQSSVTVTGNTVLNSQGQTSAIAFFQDNGGYNGVTLTGNLLAGGDYCLYAGGGANAVSNFAATGNQFSRQYFPSGGQFYTVTAQPDWGANGNVWANNGWYDMTWTLVNSATSGIVSNTITYTFPGGAPAAGQMDAIFLVSSELPLSTPAGWTLGVSTFTNSAFHRLYYLISAGGAATSVTFTVTDASQYLALAWSRWTGQLAADATGTAVNNVGATGSPPVTTGALATTGELSLACAGLYNSSIGDPVGPIWSSGYTAISTQAFFSDAVAILTAYSTTAGTAPESPAVNWTNVWNQQAIVVLTFTPALPPVIAVTGAVDDEMSWSKLRMLGVA